MASTSSLKIVCKKFRQSYIWRNVDNYMLMSAIWRQDLNKLHRVLASGNFWINAALPTKNPPIIECIQLLCGQEMEDETRKLEILKLLVQHGANVDAKSRFSKTTTSRATAAMLAAKHGHLRCLTYLLECGADVNMVCDSGDTALTLAVKEGQVSCVQLLLQHMSPPFLNFKNVSGKTALMLAATFPQDQCLQHLLEAAFDLEVEDWDGCTALMLAVKAKCLRAVMLLLDRGARVHTSTHDGTTPLSKAIDCNNNDVVTLLLQRGALEAVTHHKFSLIRCTRPENIVKLLHYGLDPTLFRQDRRRLHYAADCGPAALVRGLVMNGFPPLDLPVCDRFCIQKPMSPLACAIQHLRPNIAKYLVKNRFFTRFDIVRLCWEPNICKFLKISSDNGDTKASQCQEILRFLSSKPLSLQDLCFSAVSAAVSQCFAKSSEESESVKDWVRPPSFKEMVEQLDIPVVLKKGLLHQTTQSSICCKLWDDIDLGGEEDCWSCRCEKCVGEI